ncbi:MAG: importin-alpha export receptor [Chaenotheca gracillima]|nr:MAG: importin-alpha export receptor [Chaenotheca gracillima]
MSLPTLRMTDSRETLFRELGWDASNPGHTSVYEIMNNETLNVYEDLIADRMNLRPDARVEDPPYSYGQFTDEAVDGALGRILASASVVTQPYFVRGVNVRGDQYWVARWFLWHVFHNRGRRKTNRTQRPPQGYDEGGGEGSTGAGQRGARPPPYETYSTFASGTGGGSFYDPVRGV